MSSVTEDVTPESPADSPNTEQDATVPALVQRGDSALKVIDWVLETLAITALIALMLLTCANAMMRYVFSSPIPGSMNITLLFIMPALVFLALPRVQAVNAHIAATLVVDRLGERGQRICRVAVTIIMVLIMCVMLQGALHELAGAWGTTLGGYPALPLGPSWLFVPIGLAGAIVRGIWQIATISFKRHQDGSMVLGEQRSVNDV